MEPSIVPTALWSYGLAAFGYLLLSLYFVRRPVANWRNPVDLTLLSALALSTLWATAAFLLALTSRSLFSVVEAIFDTLRYAAWLSLVALLLYNIPRLAGPATKTLRWPFLLIALLAAGGLLINLAQALSLEFLPKNTALRVAQYIALGLAIFGLALLEQLFRNTSEDSRWNIKPLGIALIALFAFDLYYFSQGLLINHLDADAFAVRGFASLLVLPLLVLSIQRAQARKLKVTLSQAAAFQTTALVAAGLYLIAASAAGYYVRYLGGSWGGALQLAILFSALLLLLLLALSGSMRARLRIMIGKNFFRYRYDYREEWLKFTQTLSSQDDSRLVEQSIIRALADMVESPSGTLWKRAPDGACFFQSARWNLPVTDTTERIDSPMLTFLERSGWIINLEEYRHQRARYHDLTLPEWLSSTPNAWLVIPLSGSTGIVGFVVLTTARAPLDVNWEVNDLLRVAGRQAASFLIQLQASEALLEARKFDSFNRMSAFVVHDLKNIVTQLALMVKNAERHADNPEFQRDMLTTVRHSVDRMKQLMLQLREGAPPPSGRSGVNLASLVQRIKESKSIQSPGIEVTIREAVVARGDEERIERVIGHLAQNALDASPADGRIWIIVGREGGMAQVEVGDTGSGMSAEFVREHLFKPFLSTKTAGMGIGAYESRQYVLELGGDIRVESTEGAGTRFLLRLPLIEVGQPADLVQLENA